MCTSMISAVTNSRYVALGSGQQWRCYYPCGYCDDCVKLSRSEWSLRIYYEARRVFDSGGYVLMDCLTYSNRYVPRLSDTLEVTRDTNCFCREDLRLFHVRLRKRLANLGYGTDVYKYFLSAEFGDQNTKRPHYHILFFVVGVPNDIFSRLVSSCWYYGRTDGVKYRGYLYLDYMTFRSDFDFGHLHVITDYVSKYLQKGGYYQKKACKYAYWFMLENYHKDKWSDFDFAERKVFQSVKRLMIPFHLQSQGFGLYALEKVPLDYIIKYSGLCYDLFPSYGVTGLPLYYVRKLFFNNEVNIFGSRCWIPNELYCLYKDKQLDKLRFHLVSKVMSLEPFGFKVNDVDKFVDYYMYYKGRVGSASKNELIFQNPNYNLLNEGYFNYRNSRDGFCCLSGSRLDLPNCGEENVIISPSDFERDFVITESCDDSFSGFDALFDLFFSALCKKGLLTASADSIKERIRKYFKPKKFNYVLCDTSA